MPQDLVTNNVRYSGTLTKTIRLITKQSKGPEAACDYGEP